MALSAWGGGYDPLTSMFNDPFFSTFFDWDTSTAAPRRLEGRTIRIDMFEKEDGYELMADLPGVAKDTVKLRVDGDLLTITPEALLEGEGEEGKRVMRVLRSERMTRYAPRSIRLLNDADTSKTNFEHGVLKIEIPKKPEAQPHTIAIQ